ncbi:MAG: ligase-associated DNA damage response endonuclease PdeM [Rhodobacteraceae bacterium]|nr:ligase-associated DNA damage response endonuclease PdeM [Paracoccaceae bacterium]
MNAVSLTLSGIRLEAQASGALWWADRRLLAVSDLHLGRSGRQARLGGALLPPYDSAETLDRLAAAIDALRPAVVVCTGDSFDDDAAAGADDPALDGLVRLIAGRQWIWIAGNHDPAPVTIGGEWRRELRLGPLTFRHRADPAAKGEVSGHLHPKVTIAGRSHRCFLADGRRIVLPAFGAYTGGLACRDGAIASLMDPGAVAILTGRRALAVPLPGQSSPRAATAST